MKRFLAILLALCLVCAPVFTVMAAEETAEEEIIPQVVDAKIITKVLDEGMVINGVRVEFDNEFAAGKLTTSSFSVNGFTVLQTYVNNSGKIDDAAMSGKYAFVIFDEPNGIGTGSYGLLQYAGQNSAPRDVTLNVFYGAEFFEAKGFIHAEVDEFIEGEVTDAEGYTTQYRFYAPEDTSEPLPLVIWLHGAGERGDNNITQIAANRGALNYITIRSQSKNPCFVLAPQAQPTGWDASAIANINTIVLQLISEYNIDASRIYVSGCSMGGGGSKSLMNAYPDMIAASVVTANGSLSDDEALLENIKDIPVIVVTAADDGKSGENMAANYEFLTEKGYNVVAFLGEDSRNGYLYGDASDKDFEPVIAAMEEAGAIWALVTYVPGTVVPAAHWSWMTATQNETLHDWMFSQVKAAPYTGE